MKKSKAWWKENWVYVVGAVCGVVSLTAGFVVVGPFLFFMLLVGFSTFVCCKELWEARNDE